MYKQDLALNSLQKLICHETQPTNQITIIYYLRYLFYIWNFIIVVIGISQLTSVIVLFLYFQEFAIGFIFRIV